MFRQYILIAFFSVFFCVFAGDRLPIPETPVAYEPASVIKNPVSGDRVVCNQLLISFRDNVNRRIQEKILARIGGRVIGGMPDIDVYQIFFENRQTSFERFNSVFLQLQQDDNIIFVVPRKITTDSAEISPVNKIMAGFKRSGSLQLQSVSRKGPGESSNSYESVIDAHQSGLRSCLERKSRLFADFHGQVEFELELTPGGQVRHVDILASTFRNRRLLGCLVNKIRKWRDFPRHKQDSTVQLRFSFNF